MFSYPELSVLQTRQKCDHLDHLIIFLQTLHLAHRIVGLCAHSFVQQKVSSQSRNKAKLHYQHTSREHIEIQKKTSDATNYETAEFSDSKFNRNNV